MPFVETLEAYSRALYLPLRAYVRRPFQFGTEIIRVHLPKGLWDMRRAMEHTVLGSSRLVGPFDGFGTISSVANNMDSSSRSDLVSNGNTIRPTTPATSGSTSATGSGGVAGATGANMLQSQPSMIHFFTSPYFLLLCFMSIVMNRINAIVVPRNPHPLKLSVRFALKLPAFYLLMKSVLITLALTTQDRQYVPLLGWMLSGLRTTYDESHALWLSFIAMGISCTIDAFIANLHSTGTSEHTINMLEWAILFHFTPFGQDILIISLIQVCQLLTLQFLSLSSQGRNYRLIVTTFWGLLDLIHFAHAVYFRSSTYPSLQLLTRLPEVVVLLMVCISMILHALTYIVTGGNVRRQMFEPRAMPTMDEEYGLAVFKVGRACMEATRGVGLRNEVDAVVVPFGTILDRKHALKSKQSATHSSSVSSVDQSHHPSSTLRYGVSNSGFANEMPDVVETPGQRQQVSRRRVRYNVMKAFCQSSAGLLVEVAYSLHNRIVPARFRRPLPFATRTSAEAGTRMSMQDYIQLRATIEDALEQAKRSRERGEQNGENEEEYGRTLEGGAVLDEAEEEEIYSEFLARELTFSDDEGEEFDADFVLGEGENEMYEDEESELESEVEDAHQPAGQEEYEEIEMDGVESFGIRRRRGSESDSEEEDSNAVSSVMDGEETVEKDPSAWRSLTSLQDFFLDTSFISIFLSGRLQDTPLTRSQHRRVMSGARDSVQDTLEDGFNIQETGNENLGRLGLGRLPRRNRVFSDNDNKNTSNNKALLFILQKYRRTHRERSPRPNEGSSVAYTDISPPPLAQASTPEESSIYSRMLCVVCQSEPRGVLLRPCRCLALCNECREVLASRRFKQCPCCRSDVQGFSKVFLP
ncbi:hypothetical protein BGX28_004015 [Mortierella sp. GBA30]|nr:hypothetical protein BGX28_004015 [Mortierella sp. GBA30]